MVSHALIDASERSMITGCGQPAALSAVPCTETAITGPTGPSAWIYPSSGHQEQSLKLQMVTNRELDGTMGISGHDAA
jgi:hypothetical protein